MKQWEQVKTDITFIMGTRSSKWWRGKELCQYLHQLGHEGCTPKSLKWVLTQLVESGYLEKARVKPQWSLYTYRLRKHYLTTHGSHCVVERSEKDILW